MNNFGRVAMISSLAVAASACFGQQGPGHWVTNASLPGENLNRPVNVIHANADGTVFIGGQSFTVAGRSLGGAVKLVNGRWESVGAEIAGTVHGFGTYQGSTLALGFDGMAPSIGARTIARWTGSQWVAAPVDTSGTMRAVAPYGSEGLYLGGFFASAGGNLNIAHVATWTPEAGYAMVGGGRPGGVMTVLAHSDGTLYVGGSYRLPDSNYLSRWTGSQWQSVGISPNNNVNVLAELPTGEVIAGGSFTTIGGASLRSVAIWNGQSWRSPAPGIAGNVASIAMLPCGQFVVAGSFTGSVGGQQLNNLARFDGRRWWSLAGGIPNASINTICLLPSGKLAAGGAFSVGPSGSAPYYAEYDFGATLNAADFDLDGAVDCLDYDAFVAAFEAGDMRADMTGDRFIDIFDYEAYLDYFETGC